MNHRKEDYVVISDCDGVARLDIADIVRSHVANQADITMVYTETDDIESSYYITLDPDETGRIRSVQISPKLNGKANMYVNVMVLNREFLIDLIGNAVTRGLTSFGKDILAKSTDTLRIYGYKFDGYYAGIDSLQNYFRHSMELLNKDVRSELFANRDIYTKVRDSAPSKYIDGAVVKDSLISDGCTIEGTVENSILFRGVKVGKGSVVKNSIIMQDTVIESAVQLDCVITDKNVVIRDRRHLSGCEELPYFVSKGRMI